MIESIQHDYFIWEKIDANMRYGAVYDALEYQRNEKTVKLEDFKVSYEQPLS